MKCKAVLVLGIFVGCIFIVTTLFLLSDNLYRYSNSFIRFFPTHVLRQDAVFNTRYNSYYIAGIASKNIYLGNTTNPLHVLIVNSMLTDSQHVVLSIKAEPDFKLRASQIKVDSPYFYLMDGLVPAIFRGKLGRKDASLCVSKSVFFTGSVPISSASFALRLIDPSKDQYVLAKDSKFLTQPKVSPGLLQKQVDGYFCTDGILLYDKQTFKIVYVYYYRNQFICADTNMNLQYRGRTIDTVSRAHINVQKIDRDRSLILIAPPLVVNKNGYVWNGFLFIHSNLLAKNEVIDNFKNSTAIDVYSLMDGLYKFSFYLPDYQNKKVRQFQIANNKLFAIYDRNLISFDINTTYFESIGRKE